MQAVNDYLNTQQREMILFSLLECPSDEVRVAVMDCIRHVDTNQLETEEIGFLVKLLADSRNIGAG
jgi:uncharacterized protein Smg (DUF494 family)